MQADIADTSFVFSHIVRGTLMTNGDGKIFEDCIFFLVLNIFAAKNNQKNKTWCSIKFYTWLNIGI